MLFQGEENNFKSWNFNQTAVWSYILSILIENDTRRCFELDVRPSQRLGLDHKGLQANMLAKPVVQLTFGGQ